MSSTRSLALAAHADDVIAEVQAYNVARLKARREGVPFTDAPQAVVTNVVAIAQNMRLKSGWVDADPFEDDEI